jgi:hypothetical protein
MHSRGMNNERMNTYRLLNADRATLFQALDVLIKQSSDARAAKAAYRDERIGLRPLRCKLTLVFGADKMVQYFEVQTPEASQARAEEIAKSQGANSFTVEVVA